MILQSSFLVLFGLLAAQPTRTLCDLDPELDFGPVTLRAIYLSGYHDAILYDPECSTHDAVYEAAFDDWHDGVLVSNCGTDSEEYGATRSEVVVSGTVTPWDGNGYGNFSAILHRFEIFEVVEAGPVDESVPWPGDKGSQPAPMTEKIRALRDVDSNVLGALVSGNAQDLAGLLAADFVDYPSRAHAEGFLKKAAPLCGKEKIWWHQEPRVFARDSIAYAQGIYGCGSAGEGGTVVYSHVYVRIGDQWKLAMRESLVRWPAGPRIP